MGEGGGRGRVDKMSLSLRGKRSSYNRPTKGRRKEPPRSMIFSYIREKGHLKRRELSAGGKLKLVRGNVNGHCGHERPKNTVLVKGREEDKSERKTREEAYKTNKGKGGK